MGWLKEFESEDDYLDALWITHQEGVCSDFVKREECYYCRLEREREQYAKHHQH